MTSSTLFSRKLEHIQANPQVSVSITDPVAVGGRTDRATIQGDARVIDEDPHGGWERLLPIWSAKEPAIVAFLKARVALPLFFERALIEITPAPRPRTGPTATPQPPIVTESVTVRCEHDDARAWSSIAQRARPSSTPGPASPSSRPTRTRSPPGSAPTAIR